jgi:Kef-type K+ transport system membrane component KefB
MKKIITLVVLMILARVLLELPGPGVAPVPTGAARLTLVLGFLLLAASLAGSAANQFGLPRVTGYIVLGVLVGPGVLALLQTGDVSALRTIDDIAISLIALSAGGELRVSELRRRGRAMAGIMLTEMAAVFVVTAGGVLVLSSMLPFTQGEGIVTVLTIAMIFGSVAIANSPSVAIAVINDSGSRGPVTSTVLGVTVMKDVLVIVLFAVALAMARAILMDSGLDVGLALDLGWEIGGSLVVGAISGWLISLYLGRWGAYSIPFVLGAAFINAEIAHVLHLEVLLLSLSAGFFVENVNPPRGDRFIEAVEANSLPFYALFFTLAGTKIDPASLQSLGLFVALFVVLRGAAIFSGTWLGARLTGAEPAVARYAWTGFVSQAGVTLGMVVIASRAFPEWGGELVTLFVAMVAVHELVGPVLFQKGLEWAGEVGARDRDRDGAGSHDASSAAALDAGGAGH